MKIRHIPDSVEAIQVETILSVRARQREPVPQAEVELEVVNRRRISRITRMMALAIKFQGMIERGEVRDYADIARLGHVTPARITQIMNLLLLAPDIQEALLFIDGPWAKKNDICERRVRSLSQICLWRQQQPIWKQMHHGRAPATQSPGLSVSLKRLQQFTSVGALPAGKGERR